MTTSSQPLLSQVKIEVPEARYKSDLELHDRFQDFSAELLKLALAGIAVFGIILSLLGKNDTTKPVQDSLRSCSFFWLSTFCLIFLGVSVACALIHRFMASDGMYHHLRAIKLLILLEERAVNPQFLFQEKEETIRLAVSSDEKFRTSKFTTSEHFLQASAIFLVAGSLLLGAAFLQLLK